jgi:hypothetical protein
LRENEPGFESDQPPVRGFELRCDEAERLVATESVSTGACGQRAIRPASLMNRAPIFTLDTDPPPIAGGYVVRDANGQARAEADSPVVPGELFSALSWIACYPQASIVPCREQLFRFVTSKFESSLTAADRTPPRPSEFLNRGQVHGPTVRRSGRHCGADQARAGDALRRRWRALFSRPVPEHASMATSRTIGRICGR